ncbi:uncharacterized protein LOC124204517 [Daphnia pulex]|uniref:uncharacterized protein LOC124204517 n=1 Tax=Daphnia pulex TaxID=6669 RepID=UPI001EE138FD|nr:uncharacterized protein LOC124204517 [Daphnia pulex]
MFCMMTFEPLTVNPDKLSHILGSNNIKKQKAPRNSFLYLTPCRNWNESGQLPGRRDRSSTFRMTGMDRRTRTRRTIPAATDVQGTPTKSLLPFPLICPHIHPSECGWIHKESLLQFHLTSAMTTRFTWDGAPHPDLPSSIHLQGRTPLKFFPVTFSF